MQIQNEYIWTEDNLRLQGLYYHPDNKNSCVIFVHGMSGNLMENYFGHVLGEFLANKGYGFLYSHNRGYNHINDIATRKIDKNLQNGHQKVRVGAAYEMFADCLWDIDAWIGDILSKGYQKIILMGHSLGCNKSIHYLYKKNITQIKALVLLSPPDMVANGKESGKSTHYYQLVAEARQNISLGQPRKLLAQKLWDWYNLSSQTFLDLFVDHCSADNLPLMRNPDQYPELAAINLPILSIMGEYDDIVVRSLEEDMVLLAQKAISATSFTKLLIAGANHCYEDKEQELARQIWKWIKDIDKQD